MVHEYRVDEQIYRVKPVYRSDEIAIDLDGEVHSAVLDCTGPGSFTLRTQGRTRSLLMHRDGDRVFVHIDGFDLEICCEKQLDRLHQQALAAHGGHEITAPMPGVVVAVRVEIGQAVETGSAVIVIESMKLQTELGAACAGIVSEVKYAAGESFEKGAVLVRLEPPHKDSGE